MKPFIVGGGTLLGVLAGSGRLLCLQCRIRHAEEKPCIVCGEPVCRHCASDLGELGHCCASHGNVALALAREATVEMRMRARPRARRPHAAAPGANLSGSAAPATISTPYYRSKDEAERALRFLAALRGVRRVLEVDFGRELGCEGSARFDVWRAVGLPGEDGAADGPSEPREPLEPDDPLPWPRSLAAPRGRPPAAWPLR